MKYNKPNLHYKRTIAFSLVLLFSIDIANAQLSMETGASHGYEWNIFRNPELLVQKSDTLGREQLWQNSDYNEFFLEVDYLKKWGSSKLRLSGDITSDIYHQQGNAQKEYYKVSLSYRTKYASRKFFEFSPSYARKKQAEISESDNIFRNRRSYSQFTAPLHFDFYLKKKAWLRLETGYRYRSYDISRGEKTAYYGFNAEALFSKRWVSRIRSEFELEAEWNTRNQTEEEIGSEPIKLSKRIYSSYRFRTALSFESLSKSIQIKFPFTYKTFSDSPTERFNYTQFEGGMRLSFRMGKSRLTQSMTGTIRNFTNLSVSNGELLNYNYVRSSTRLTVPVLNRLEYTIRASLVHRISNRSGISSSSFRGFTNSYVETGFSIKL
ncbi:MAG: hypothetical protein RLN81_03940 [Balneolaceae bacterium]